MKKNKKIILASIIIIIVLITCSFTLYNKTSKQDQIKVNYENGKNIEITNIKDNYNISKKITIENISNKDIYYSISWNNISNTFINQSNLLYEINKQAKSYMEVGTSQLPVVSSPIFPKVKIKANTTHIYILKIKYKDNSDIVKESNSVFKGNIKVTQIKNS